MKLTQWYSVYFESIQELAIVYKNKYIYDLWNLSTR